MDVSHVSIWEHLWASLPEWSRLHYAYRDAGTPWEDVPGLSIRMGAKRPNTNCCVFTWAALLQAAADAGRPREYDADMQRLAMVVDPTEDRQGAAGAAVVAGLAEWISIDDYGPGVGPCVVQMWRKAGSKSGGHSLFFAGCASDGETTEGVVTLEANGRNDGTGSVLGLDGVGSRTKTGSGNWRDVGPMTVGAHLYTLSELRDAYEEIFIARLI